MSGAFAKQFAAVRLKMSDEIPTLHPEAIFRGSRITSSSPASSLARARFASSTSATASRRFSRTSSSVALTELVIQQLKDDAELRARFMEHGIEEIDIRRVLSEIFEKPPIIGLPIDRVGRDLREWAQTLKTEVKLWTVRKLVEFGNPENVLFEIPDGFRPDLDTTADESPRRGYTYYDVNISDLMTAGLLQAGATLGMSYKPRDGERRTYEATVQSDGSLPVLGRNFQSPSYAALLGIQDAGSERTTVNGWTSWRTQSGESLADLRAKLLAQSEDAPES